MELTARQNQAVNIALEKYANHEKYMVITGFAGAGKSTTLRYILAALVDKYNLNPEEDIANVAFTGRAATVLAEKGNVNCMTLHKLLYNAIPLENGSFIFAPKDYLEYKIVCVDECSMLTKDFENELFKHDVFVIFMGDPGQLSAVDKSNQSDILSHTDVFLDEIMRQAKESEIIRVSMDIREGRTLKPFRGNEVQIYKAKDADPSMLLWSDITLVAKNDTRNSLNAMTRQLKGYEEPIVRGERLVCLNNYWKCVSKAKNPLTNGTFGNLEAYIEDQYRLKTYPFTIDYLKGEFVTEMGRFTNLAIDKQCLLTGIPRLTQAQKAKMFNTPQAFMIPKELTYGYAATVWKMQGSQCDKVLLVEENFPWDRQEHIKYMYTGLTRAIKKCVIIKK